MGFGSSRKKRSPSPLTYEKLRDLALWYVGRYAVSEAKLRSYLTRKIAERGWEDDRPADPKALAHEFSELGYVDDEALAGAKARSSIRKGHGARRLSQQLYHDGISENNSVEAMDEARQNAWTAADNFARKRRIGPYAETAADDNKRRKQFAAFMRAGHDYEIARKFVEASPGDIMEE